MFLQQLIFFRGPRLPACLCRLAATRIPFGWFLHVMPAPMDAGRLINATSAGLVELDCPVEIFGQLSTCLYLAPVAIELAVSIASYSIVAWCV